MLRQLFRHPKAVCMTYTEHMRFSLYLSMEFAKASFCAVVHAFYPDAFVTHSSDTVARIQDAMKKIGCR